MRHPVSGSPPKLFFRLACALGLMYWLVNPPFAVNDEDVHMFRLYELSTGQLLTQRDADGEYHMVPKDYAELGARYQGVVPRNKGRVRVRDLRKLLRRGRPEGPLVRTHARAGGYAPLAYHVQLPVIWLMRHTNLGVLWHLYFARLGSLAVYLLLTTRAVQVAGSLQWLFFGVGLMPMALTQAAGVSTDGFVIGLALLFFAWVARGGLGEGAPLTRSQQLEAAACLALLTLCKPVYVFAGMSLVLIRTSSPRRAWWPWVLASGSVATATAVYVTWHRLVSSIPGPPDGGQPMSDQLAFLLSDPWRSAKLAAHIGLQSVDDLLVEAIFVRHRISPGMRFVGGLASALYAQLLVALAWGAAAEHARAKLHARWFKVAVLALCAAAMISAVPSALYLCCMEVGANHLRGFHGRYLIPAFPAVLLALSLLGRPVLARWMRGAGRRVPVRVIVAANVLCQVSLIAWHYYYVGETWPL